MDLTNDELVIVVLSLKMQRTRMYRQAGKTQSEPASEITRIGINKITRLIDKFYAEINKEVKI